MTTKTKVVIALVLAAVFVAIAMFGGKPDNTQAIQLVTALNLEEDFTMALNHGASRGELCGRAMIVKEAYLQADFESGFILWSDRANDYCGW